MASIDTAFGFIHVEDGIPFEIIDEKRLDKRLEEIYQTILPEGARLEITKVIDRVYLRMVPPIIHYYEITKDPNV